MILAIHLLLKRLISRREEWNAALDDELGNKRKSLVLLTIMQRFLLPALLLGLTAAAMGMLEFTPRAELVLERIYTALVTIIVIRGLGKVLEVSFNRFAGRESRELQGRKLRPLLVAIKLALWVIGITVLLANFGVDVTAAVAGLGLTGFAVAIAAKGILGDLVNYFVILVDKPFVLGEAIGFGDKVGTVERIGMKSTHLRIPNGELLIVTNSELANAKVHNYKRLERRRGILSVGVTYQTVSEQLAQIPRLLREIIESTAITDGVVCDRVHFKSFGTFSLDFEAVYYLPVPNYLLFMDVQQDIHLRVLRAFSEQGITFAHPSQVLFVEKSGVHPVERHSTLPV